MARSVEAFAEYCVIMYWVLADEVGSALGWDLPRYGEDWGIRRICRGR